MSTRLPWFVPLFDKITEGFSSLNYISKRLNLAESSVESASNEGLMELTLKTNDMLQFEKSNDDAIDVDELITIINLNSQLSHSDELFGLEDESSNTKICIEAISKLRCKYFKNENVRIAQTLKLEFDLEEERDREFMTVLSRAKLPHIDKLTIKNFCEYDEDLETFINSSLTSVNIFEFLCGSYCEDVHDYLSIILQLKSITSLRLKGFIIDLDDSQELIGSKVIQKLTLES